jgi:penicillin-binding protein 2
MRAYNQSRSRIIQLIFIAVFVLIIVRLVTIQLLGDYGIDAFNNAVYRKIVQEDRVPQPGYHLRQERKGHIR